MHSQRYDINHYSALNHWNRQLPECYNATMKCDSENNDGNNHPCGGEKAFLSRTAEEIDRIYSEEFDRLRNDMISQGIDVTAGEGLRTFVLAVRKLNERFR